MSLEAWLCAADDALRCLLAPANAARATPRAGASDLPVTALSDAQRRHSAGLMRVNHVGEVCAQAMYSSQALFANGGSVRENLRQAAREEQDHLAWTAQRLEELGSRTSLLNPLWYAGAFAVGALAARAGDGISLGFVEETERQVSLHLSSHLTALPVEDVASAAIVAQMKADEESHGAQAHALGAEALPPLATQAMRAAAKVMTTVAYRV